MVESRTHSFYLRQRGETIIKAHALYDKKFFIRMSNLMFPSVVLIQNQSKKHLISSSSTGVIMSAYT